jgi:cytochrome bd-type quinol oxidase subunit 1
MDAVAPLPLAEVRWTFRRWYTYVLTGVICALLAFVVHRLQDPAALKVIGLALVALIALSQLLYLAGATVTDLARLAAAVKSAPPVEGRP